jgi:hypothetical protein
MRSLDSQQMFKPGKECKKETKGKNKGKCAKHGPGGDD